MSIINEGNIVYSILYATQRNETLIIQSIDRSIVGCFTELITAIKIKCRNEEKTHKRLIPVLRPMHLQRTNGFFICIMCG